MIILYCCPLKNTYFIFQSALMSLPLSFPIRPQILCCIIALCEICGLKSFQNLGLQFCSDANTWLSSECLILKENQCFSILHSLSPLGITGHLLRRWTQICSIFHIFFRFTELSKWGFIVRLMVQNYCMIIWAVK